MTIFLKTTLAVTFVIFLFNILALEAKIAEKHDKTDEFSVLDAADTKAGGFRWRIKRNLFQFGLMIMCETGQFPFRYNDYGCYCGLGGRGTPLDNIDECCKDHDECYNKIVRKKRCQYKTDVYHKIYKMEKCSKCASTNDACQMAICDCDSTAAKCFARFKKEYNSNYKTYPKSKC